MLLQRSQRSQPPGGTVDKALEQIHMNEPECYCLAILAYLIWDMDNGNKYCSFIGAIYHVGFLKTCSYLQTRTKNLHE